MLQIACKYEAGHQKCCKLHAKRRGWGIIWGTIPLGGGGSRTPTGTMYVCMYVCICIYIYMYVSIYVRMYVCMHACMYVRMYVIFNIYIYKFISFLFIFYSLIYYTCCLHIIHFAVCVVYLYAKNHMWYVVYSTLNIHTSSTAQGGGETFRIGNL